MPYEYERLTSEEREEIVRLRRERGYPLHAPPHPIRSAGCYLITAATYRHAPILDRPERRTEFEQRLLTAMGTPGVEVHGWVILPNHYHLLATVESLDQVSSAVRLLHGGTSRKWNLEDGQTGRKVWYRFADRWMRDERQAQRALNYIHFNPVKHGWAEDAYAWRWSSLIEVLAAEGRDALRARWQEYPPGDMGGDWDP
jgi:putative transposase